MIQLTHSPSIETNTAHENPASHNALLDGCATSIRWATEAATRGLEGPEPLGCSHGVWNDRVEGMPQPLTPGGEPGVYLWHDTNGWHLAVLHPVGHEVTGVISTDGVIGDVQSQLQLPNFVGVEAAEQRVAFRVNSPGAIGGFDFKVGCGTQLVAGAFIDGRRVTPERIFLGANGSHPEAVPFFVVRIASSAAQIAPITPTTPELVSRQAFTNLAAV